MPEAVSNPHPEDRAPEEPKDAPPGDILPPDQRVGVAVIGLGTLTIDEVQGIRQAVTAGRLEAELKLNITQSAVTSTLFCNFQNVDPFKAQLCRNLNFRKALSHLVDRETIIRIGLGGLGKALHGPISSGNTKWYNDSLFDEGKTKFSYNPARAAALLAGLGFTKKNAQGFLVNSRGQTIKMNALVVSTEALQKVAAPIIIEDMKKVGIDASFTVADNGSVINPSLRNFNANGTRNFDLSFTDFGGVFDPPTRRNLYNLNGVAHIWNLKPNPSASSPSSCCWTNSSVRDSAQPTPPPASAFTTNSRRLPRPTCRSCTSTPEASTRRTRSASSARKISCKTRLARSRVPPTATLAS